MKENFKFYNGQNLRTLQIAELSLWTLYLQNPNTLNISMQIKNTSTCHVCFVKPYKLSDYSKIVKCIKCHLTCHKSCYNPSLEGTKFICDLCSQDEDGTMSCYICGNPGLLKKVQSKFAHPICLLFSPNVIVAQYNTLQFSILKQETKKDNKILCQVCKKPQNLEKCYLDCQNHVHMYCAWKSYSESQQDEKKTGWNHNPVADQLQHRLFFEKKASEYLNLYSPTLMTYIESPSMTEIQIRQFQMVCPDHNQGLYECCTGDKYFSKNKDDNEPKIEYLQCDQCLKWYHLECLDKKTLPKVIDKETNYVCIPCQNFSKIIKSTSKQQIYLKKMPRLNICELIYLQWIFEQRNYSLRPNELKLMFQFPIEPSLLFLEQKIKSNIRKNLKVSVFEKMYHMRLKYRIQRKHFEFYFVQKIEKALQLIVGKKSLFQMSENSEQEIENCDQPEQILDEQERDKLEKWIKLLRNFKDKYEELEIVVTKLIKKMQKWLKTLTIDESIQKGQQQQSQDQKIEQEQGESTKKQEFKNQEQENQKQVKSQQSQYEQYEQIVQEKLEQVYKQQEQNYAYPGNIFSHEDTSKTKQIVICDQEKQKYLLEFIKALRKNVSADKVNLQPIYQTLARQKKNKTFLLDIILNQNLSNQSAQRQIILEVLFQHFLKIQQHSNQILNQSLQQNSFNESSIILQKDELKKTYQQRIKYLEKFKDSLMEIYYASNSQVKIEFSTRIQYMISQTSDLVQKFHKQELKLQTKLNFQEALNQYTKNPSQKHHLIKTLKEMVGSTFNSNDLVLLRISMEKLQVSKKIKKVKFTNEYRIMMTDQYDEHCKSSSQHIQRESIENQNHNEINLRKEIMAIQQKSLLIWLKMYGLIFNLANSFNSLEKTTRMIENLDNSKTKYYIQTNMQPLETIEEILNLDYSERLQSYKSEVFFYCLDFFSKLSKEKINWKKFHSSLAKVITKIGQFCIMFSFENIQCWALKQEHFIAMRTIYKNFRNQPFLNKKPQAKELFMKIWEILEADQLFQAYLLENQNALFKDPEFTYYLYNDKFPDMTKFYKEVGIINRIHKMKTINIWIVCYLRILKEVGFERIFGDRYKNSPLRKKYENPVKTTFNRLHQSIALLQQSKFPQCEFSNKILSLYKEAEVIQSQVEGYFAKNRKFLERSFELKKQFLMFKNVERHCLQYSEELHIKQNTVSTEEFEKIIEILRQNNLSDFITWELEKIQILNTRADFLELVEKIQKILIKSDTNVKISELNLIFFEIISYPFHYENLSVFYLYIRQRVERENILSLQQRQFPTKQKEKVESVEMVYRNIVESLQPKQKMNFQNRLTRDKIMQKFNFIENRPEFKQIIIHPVLKQIRHKILDHVQTFDEIKESSQMIVQKVSENKLLNLKEIQALSETLYQYKNQRVFELGFEVLYSQVEIYKLSYSPIPDTLLDMQVLLEQFKSLKTSFKTIEILKKMKEIEVKISGREGK